MAGDFGILQPLCLDQAMYGREGAEVEQFGVRLVAKAEYSAGEVLVGPLLGEQRIVKDLVHPLRREGFEVLCHLPEQRVRILPQLGRHRLDLALHVDHIHQQQRMMRSERPARLRNDVGHREVVLAARSTDGVHHIVGVLPHGIVDAGCPGGA